MGLGALHAHWSASFVTTCGLMEQVRQAIMQVLEPHLHN